MQSMMCADEVDSLDSSLFHIPILECDTYQQDSPRNPQTVAIVEAGKQLLVAAKDGDVEVVRQLISKGAPFTTDWLGVSPLHLAAQNNHVTTAEVLLRAGISRDARTKVERTPLHLAAQEGHAAMVELLIAQGADVNCRDMLNMTPLHWAVEKYHADVVEALLKAGGEPYAISKFGKTPMSIARDMARSNLIHLLETTISNPVVTVKQTEEMHQSTLEATETIAADLNMSEDITRQLAAGTIRQRIRLQKFAQTTSSTPERPAPTAAAAEEMESLASQINRPSVDTSQANNTMQLLQAHGITMLPTDKSTIVQSAMESGQTVVLTEAGKMALNLTGMGGRIMGPKRTAAGAGTGTGKGTGKGTTTTVRTVGAAKTTVTSSLAGALSGTLCGGVQRRSPAVLGNSSRIIKIHPSQLVALGGGRVSVQVPSFKVDQLLMQQGKRPNIMKRVVPAGKLQKIILTSPQQQQLLQQVRRQQSQEKDIAEGDRKSRLAGSVEVKEDVPSDSSEITVKNEPYSEDFARIERELAEARKQAAKYKKKMEKKEMEAELYLQQLRSLKSAAK